MLRRSSPRRALAALALAIAVPSGAQAPSPSAVGEWLGTLTGAAVPLRVGFSIRARPSGALEADLDSYDQGAMDIPADSVRQGGDTVRIWIRRIAGAYQGTLSPDGRTLTGTWTQGPRSTPFVLTRADSAALAAARPRRPQEPTGPLPYDAEEVSFESAPGVRLAGTITRPRAPGRFPAVILVSGSGPQDRDEALLGHRPFLVLADHLTRSGIVVLRYDDRGTAKSTGSFAAATSADFAADARAALALLRSRPGVRPGAVGVVGHSEGGLIAPMVAQGPGAADFIVLLAGPGIAGDSILLLQSDLIAKANGTPDSVRARSARMSRALYAAVRETPDSARLAARLREMVAELTPAQRAQAGLTEPAVEALVGQVTSPWFRYFLVHDPAAELRRVRVPVLALNGTLDLQVPYRENLSAIARALRAGGNRQFEADSLPGLNHLFQTSRAGSGAPSEYAQLEETMSPAALQRVSSWILRRFPPGVTKDR